MSQVHVNPEELERFVRELRQFNTQMNDSMSRIQGQFARLGETWQDQEHQKFAQQFEQTMRTLRHFISASEQHVPLLQKKAAIIRQFLNR